MPKASTPRFYFSLRSPYSWLAYADLHRRYPDLAGRLEWRPFWEPDARSERMLAEAGGRFVYTPMSKEKHLYILQDIRRLAAERGLRVGWPVDVDPCWEVPHLAYFAALEHGQGHEFIRLVCDLRWRDGRDICQPDTMAEAADRLGLDPGELAGAHADEGRRKQGVEALLDIYRDDVFGVPFFIHGRQKYWGLDRLAAFATAVGGDGASEEPAGQGPAERGLDLEPAVAADSRASDFGPAGGCG